MPKKYLALVEWLDCTASGEWLEDDQVHQLAPMRSLGFVVGEKVDSISLSTTLHGETWLGAVTIPKAVITGLWLVDEVSTAAIARHGDLWFGETVDVGLRDVDPLRGTGGSK